MLFKINKLLQLLIRMIIILFRIYLIIIIFIGAHKHNNNIIYFDFLMDNKIIVIIALI